MKKLLKRRVGACLIALLLCVSMLQSGILYADTTSPNADGYVTVIFEDYGERVAGDEGTEYPKALGEILNVKVPCEEGDSIADITMKVLESKGIECVYGGTVESGFYIDAIKNFELNGKTYGTFGSLSAGSMSGWMVSINNWFASTSASDTLVESGDKITWQYSCQWGADINYDYMMPSAEITALNFANENGVLSPEFTTDAAVYTYCVGKDITSVALEVSQENYGAKITYKVGDQLYKPMQQIPVVSGTVIEITSEYTMWDGSPNLTDAINITINQEKKIEVLPTEPVIPATDEPAPTETEMPATENPIPTEPVELKNEQAEAVFNMTEKWLVENVKNPTYGTVGGDWAILGLARSDADVRSSFYDHYYMEIVNILKATNGVLHERKYTEYERVLLALTAAGYDATNISGYDLLAPLADYDKVIWQGVNSAAYALLAFDSHDSYVIPTVKEGKTQTTRENLKAYLLEKQLEDGGWSLNREVSDVDMTALVIQAFAPYYETDVKIKAAVEKALVCLSEKQKEDGTFGDYTGMSNAESTAQVIIALTALGINPDTDIAFIKADHSVMDGLCSFAVENGGFSHVLNGSRDGIATEQSYNALVAYFRMMDRKSFLYNMNDVILKTKTVETTDLPLEGSNQKTDTDGTNNTSGDKLNETANQQKLTDTTSAPTTGDATDVVVLISIILVAVSGLIMISKKQVQM